MITTITLVVIVGFAMIASLVQSRSRTKASILRALKIGRGVLPEIATILLLISLVLSLLSKDMIQSVLGNERVYLSTIMGALIGSVTIIPGIIAFPLSKELLVAGAAPIALAAFITTLTMVGLATSPIEKKYFGLRFTLYRNAGSFILAVGIALIMGLFL